MSPCKNILDELEDRRIELGMSIAALARIAGLGKATVQKALRGSGTDSFSTMRAIGGAVGIEIGPGATKPVPVKSVRRKQAKSKAEFIVRLVAGNSALENHRIDPKRASQLQREATRQLLGGSNLALWA